MAGISCHRVIAFLDKLNSTLLEITLKVLMRIQVMNKAEAQLFEAEARSRSFASLDVILSLDSD